MDQTVSISRHVLHLERPSRCSILSLDANGGPVLATSPHSRWRVRCCWWQYWWRGTRSPHWTLIRTLFFWDLCCFALSVGRNSSFFSLCQGLTIRVAGSSLYRCADVFCFVYRAWLFLSIFLCCVGSFVGLRTFGTVCEAVASKRCCVAREMVEQYKDAHRSDASNEIFDVRKCTTQ